MSQKAGARMHITCRFARAMIKNTIHYYMDGGAESFIFYGTW
jgi:hypothetical protein